MNTLLPYEPNKYLEPEELDFWEPTDFDDMLQGVETSNLDNDFTLPSDLGLYASRFQWRELSLLTLFLEKIIQDQFSIRKRLY